ncbi:sugar transferase [Huintestinicola sp.]|uniref:sugar transferase n=1 Tax=Huintestinicola sp. TaxID=2981661 RepID=UPI003D7E683B
MNVKKRDKYKRFIMGLISGVLIAFLLGSYAYVWLTHYNIKLENSRIQADYFGWKGNLLIFGVYLILIFLFSRIYNGFRIGLLRVSDIIYSQSLSVIFINGITYVQICLLERAVADVPPIALKTIVDIAFIFIWALAGNRIYSKLYAPRKMVIIYGSRQAVPLIEKMSRREDRFMICRAVSCEEDMDTITQLINEFDAAIICDVPSEKKNDILKICFAQSKRTYITPKLSDIIIRGAEQIHLFDTPLLVCRNSGLSAEELIMKRALDLAVSVIGLIVTLPIMLITALCIKLYDGGPVFYTQERLTKDGRIFKVYKFRSMRTDAESDGVARLAGENDDRITPVGKIIRKVRIDELPQILNILKGDMSIVGPRPERPELASENEKVMPEFRYRLKVKAGLTGYAQVLGKYNTTPYDKLRLDLMYIEQYSFLLDLKLILMTIKILFIPESTEGVKEEKSA